MGYLSCKKGCTLIKHKTRSNIKKTLTKYDDYHNEIKYENNEPSPTPPFHCLSETRQDTTRQSDRE